MWLVVLGLKDQDFLTLRDYWAGRGVGVPADRPEAALAPRSPFRPRRDAHGRGRAGPPRAPGAGAGAGPGRAGGRSGRKRVGAGGLGLGPGQKARGSRQLRAERSCPGGFGAGAGRGRGRSR